MSLELRVLYFYLKYKGRLFEQIMEWETGRYVVLFPNQAPHGSLLQGTRLGLYGAPVGLPCPLAGAVFIFLTLKMNI